MRERIIEVMAEAMRRRKAPNYRIDAIAALDAALEVMMEPDAVANLSAAILINVLRSEHPTVAPITETLAKHFTTLKGQP